MAWRMARALNTQLGQINVMWPDRSKAADGGVGDLAHQNRRSDHNPNSGGVVCARDYTHDPRRGFDAGKFAETLIKHKDPRLNYVIWDRRIAQAPSFAWQKYTGSNPHNHHVHVSLKQSASLYDVTNPWQIDQHAVAVTPATKLVPPKLSVGTSGRDVEHLQELLNKHSGIAPLKLDGDFGARTKAAVIAFQKSHGLGADGIVGPYTWDALKGET